MPVAYEKYKVQVDNYAKRNIMAASFIVNKSTIKMSRRLKNGFKLNLFTLQAFPYMLEDHLEITVGHKLGIFLEAQYFRNKIVRILSKILQ